MKFLHSIFFKLFSAFLLLSLIPLIVAEWITYNSMSQTLYDELNQNTISIQDQMMKSLNSFTNDLQRMELAIINNPITSKILKVKEEKEFPKHFKEFDKMLKSVDIIRPENVGITIMNEYGYVYHYNYPLNQENKNFYNFPWIPDVKFLNKSYFSQLHERTYSYDNTQQVFTYIKRLSSYDLQSNGLLLIDFDLTILNDFFSNFPNNDESGIFIVNEHGNTIYPTDLMDKSNILETAVHSRSETETINYNGIDYRLIKKHHEETGWTIISYFNEFKLYNSVYKIRDITISTILICIIFCFIASLFISHQISQPIRNLKKLMVNFSGGNLNQQFREIRKDEIGQLGKGFNQMTIKIKELIDQIYLVQQKKRQAEMKALQSQINPHFLYNTLESINALARKKKETEISKMIVLLGRLLRFNIGTFEEFVTIKQELNYVKHYLEIYKLRSNNNIDFSISVDATILDFYIVKWVLQPIVENSILHGYKENERTGIIHVIGFMKDDNVYLVIKDQGNGMTKDTLESINRKLETDYNVEKSNKSIGLHNVQSRIKLHYGPQFGIHIESISNVGTKVTVKLPRRTSIE